MSIKLNFIIIIFISLFSLFGETTFSNLDLNENGTLIFHAEHNENYDKGNYTALIQSNPMNKEFSLLTHYPEESFITNNGKELFIWNRFGLYEKNVEDNKLPSLIDIYPSLEKGDNVQMGKLMPLSISPNGNYFLYYRPVDWITGDLLIYDKSRGFSQLVTNQIEREYSKKAIQWSEDSRYFAYTKNRKLYYFPIDKYVNDQLPEEGTRQLSTGSPGSFKWGTDNSLYFIVQNEVLSVNTSEMFALSFYDKPLQIGTVAGQLFFDFNANFDDFWISPNGKNVLIRREEGAVFLLDLTFRNYSDYSEIRKFPFLNLPSGYNIKNVQWSERGKVLILIGNALKGEDENRLYLYDPVNSISSFIEVEEKGIRDISLSPDKSLVSLLYKDKLRIKVFDTWKLIREETVDSKLRVHWINNEGLVLVGENISTQYNITTGSQNFLFLSQCTRSGFSLNGNIKAEESGETFFLEEGTVWKQTNDLFYDEKKLYNSELRVFLTENINPFIYENQIMVRSIENFNTESLIPDFEPLYTREIENEIEEEYSFVFNHGSRIRRREVSLVFNITDSITDLSEILNILAVYNIRATFFINGNVIRKYPQAAKMLSETDHEIGSLFYTMIDMTDRKYNIDKEFIKRGLARNEDDYFRATGKELLPFWHSPWYFVNSQIVEASKEMNYTYIGRDFDSLDWIGIEDDFLYYDATSILKKIIDQKRPGSIIPLSVGTIANREDYLFQKLEILINGLINEGYRLVTVGELKEHAK